jgi:hypothetical protein
MLSSWRFTFLNEFLVEDARSPHERGATIDEPHPASGLGFETSGSDDDGSVHGSVFG